MNKKYKIFGFGDSIASGFNPYIASFKNVDLFSYIDIFANNIKSAKQLKEYNNIAVFGDTLEEQLYRIKHNAKNLKNIKESDIVICTIGATSLLEYIKIFSVLLAIIGSRAVYGRQRRFGADNSRGGTASNHQTGRDLYF